MEITLTRTRTLFGSALAIAAITLAGCASGPTDASTTDPPAETTAAETSPAESSEPTDTGTPTPEETSSDGQFTMPGCEDLVSAETLTDGLGEDAEFIPSDQGVEAFFEDAEAATDALDGALQSEYCVYGIPSSDSAFGVAVVDLDKNAQQSLIEALESDDAFTEVGGDDSGRTFMTETEHAMSGEPMTVYYYIEGARWITVETNDPEFTEEVTEEIADVIDEANPSM